MTCIFSYLFLHSPKLKISCVFQVTVKYQHVWKTFQCFCMKLKKKTELYNMVISVLLVVDLIIYTSIPVHLN